MGYGIGEFKSSGFPSEPRLIPSSKRTILTRIDNLLENPGVNVIGLAEVKSNEKINITELLQNAPTNRIWFNVSDEPMIIKITGNGVSKSWMINPGFGIALGKWHNLKEASISRMAQFFGDLFEDNIIRQKA